ncbi:hypothetical protein E2605_14900 [Dysgonomonas capnocytophagoides]|uniref:Uncharacterized protein n=1 Tax=Dysgonomonas capnocytophagoides TaxID=45254 RepID=A0A4Y8L343_9BACT|nr:hypothetical protein [Dysgonomonas capnocytophagoides]TFD94658.1 hypothetical protein E2605_14900 [Dysgonomonas capnocytophagoides]
MSIDIQTRLDTLQVYLSDLHKYIQDKFTRGKLIEIGNTKGFFDCCYLKYNRANNAYYLVVRLHDVKKNGTASKKYVYITFYGNEFFNQKVI